MQRLNAKRYWHNFITSEHSLTALLALIILILGIMTRLAVPVYPAGNTVFDESYFVPQVESYAVNRYYFDPHPPLGKMLLYAGLIAVNPDAASKLDAEKLGNKVDNYKTPLDLNGIRLAPRIFGSLVPVLVFLLTLEFLTWRHRKLNHKNVWQVPWEQIVAFVVALLAVFENILIVESRYALLTQIMLFFMLLTVWLSVKYYKAESYGRSEIYFALACFALGAAVSVKWLALGAAPVLVLLALIKEYKLWHKPRTLPLVSIWLQRFAFMGLAALTVYLLVFVWHFDQIKHYSPAASEVSESFQQELKTDMPKVGLIGKVLEWQRLAQGYSKGVPMLDYTKSDEIGSMWITWPMMARPISYYWETPGDGTYAFVYLIGNPVNWVLSLFGVLMLCALAVARMFGLQGFTLKHWTLLLLYFANWLPFALIDRVMYLYHYIPAFTIGLIILGVWWYDFGYPRLYQLAAHKPWKWLRRETVVGLLMLGLLIASLVGFWYFSPFTYLQPLTKEQFTQRKLLKEWNMKWPGG